MKLKMLLIAASLAMVPAYPQRVNLNMKITVVSELKEHVEDYEIPVSTEQPYTITTVHPVKVGTVVWLYVDGMFATVVRAVVKTADPLIYNLAPEQKVAGNRIYVVYKSEE